MPLAHFEGQYEILGKLGEGGAGAIYKVRHRLLDEQRVIKVLRPEHAEDPYLKRRFRREARMAIRLRHPNIAQLYDFAVDDQGTGYIVMEFIDGVTLEELLRHRVALGLPLSVEIARQGLKALAYLHRNGTIHRDVAPDNLMLTTDHDREPLVKLIDLGIAKRLDAEGGSLTHTGAFLGKVRYSSPEQFSGSGGAAALDQRSDVYSFGVLLYELLTGQCPVRGNNLSQLVAAHVFQPPLEFGESDPEGRVPDALRQGVLAALEKDPDNRLGSCDELASRLEPFRGERTGLAAELERVLQEACGEATGGASGDPGVEHYQDPGSTQDRLDRQFGLAKDAGDPETEEPPRGPRESAPSERSGQISRLIAAGNLEEALEAIDEGREAVDPELSALAASALSPAADTAPAEPPVEPQADDAGRPAPGGPGEAVGDDSPPPAPKAPQPPAPEAQPESPRPGGGERTRTVDLGGGEDDATLDPIAAAVLSIRRALAAGHGAQAAEMLAFARARYGRRAEFDELDEQL